MEYTDECKYCMRYLLDHGVELKDVPDLISKVENFNKSYSLVKLDTNYWTDIAADLRNIWPTGEKDGKYPWRDTVTNLGRRLQVMWCSLLPTKNYTKEQILTVARKYVAQFENDTKYMKTLKYFVLKQEKSIDPNGKIKNINSSTLANMLEGAEEQGWFADDTISIDENIVWEGELI